MKRLILSTIAVGMLIGFSGCSHNPEDTLQESLNKYKECMIENDYTCQAKYLDPTPFKEMGSSISDAMKGIKSSGMKIVDIQMNKPSKISKNGNILRSSISYSITAKMHGQEIKTDASINAISKDDGSTWLFSSKYEDNTQESYVTNNPIRYDCSGANLFKGNEFFIILKSDGSIDSNFSGIDFNGWEKQSNGDISIQPDMEGHYTIGNGSAASALTDVNGKLVAMCFLAEQ